MAEPFSLEQVRQSRRQRQPHGEPRPAILEPTRGMREASGRMFEAKNRARRSGEALLPENIDAMESARRNWLEARAGARDLQRKADGEGTGEYNAEIDSLRMREAENRSAYANARSRYNEAILDKSEAPVRGESPTGVGFATTRQFQRRGDGAILSNATLLSDDNRALVEMRNETPEEFRARHLAAVDNEIARARRERNANRLVENPDGTIGYSGHASMSADTGMAVGSRAAQEHGAALARIGGSGIYGGGYSQSRLGGMLAANRAAGFSGGRVGAGRLIGKAGAEEAAGRRKDFLEAAKIRDAREGADADRALRREESMAKAGIAREKIAGENQRAADDRAERRRQFDATLERRNKERTEDHQWELEADNTARTRFENDRAHDEQRADELRDQQRQWALEDDERAAKRAQDEYDRMDGRQKKKTDEELNAIKGNWGAIIHSYLSQDIDRPPPSLNEYMELIGGENVPSVAQKDYRDFMDLLEQRRNSIRAQRQQVV